MTASKQAWNGNSPASKQSREEWYIGVCHSLDYITMKLNLYLEKEFWWCYIIILRVSWRIEWCSTLHKTRFCERVYLPKCLFTKCLMHSPWWTTTPSCCNTSEPIITYATNITRNTIQRKPRWNNDWAKLLVTNPLLEALLKSSQLAILNLRISYMH